VTRAEPLVPDAIMRLGLGFWGSKTLLSAVELGVFTAWPKPREIRLWGCGLDRHVRVPGGDYEMTLSVTTPHIQLANDGKQPLLAPFGNAIAEAARKACAAAHRAVAKPQATLSQRRAAWLVMSQAYHQRSCTRRGPTSWP